MWIYFDPQATAWAVSRITFHSTWAHLISPRIWPTDRWTEDCSLRFLTNQEIFDTAVFLILASVDAYDGRFCSRLNI
jgi:hypothetical protein